MSERCELFVLLSRITFDKDIYDDEPLSLQVSKMRIFQNVLHLTEIAVLMIQYEQDN